MGPRADTEPSPNIAPTGEQETPLAEWSFSRAGTLGIWTANAHLSEVTIRDGALACRASGPDPILELQPRLDLPMSPWQVVEIRLQADRDGIAELFWSPTDQGPYGGFSQERSLRFPVRGDGAAHTYRLRPFWHADQRLRRLRLDLYDGTSFAWSGLRILEPTTHRPITPADFDFGTTQGDRGWRGIDGAELAPAPKGWNARLPSPDSLLIAPPVDLDASTQTWASIRFAADRGRRGTLLFATSQTRGLHRLTFPIEADGREHTYQLDLLTAAAWRGRIVALALKPTDHTNATVRLHRLRIADQPQGEPELRFLSCATEDALPRAGQPFTVTARILNGGGSTASNVVANPILPSNGPWSIESSSPPDRSGSVEPGAEVRWSWQLRGPAGAAEIPVRVVSANAAAAETRVRLRLTDAPAITPKPAYVPEPRPVRGPYEVGVYYFPGWQNAGPWEPIRDYPERRPVLGWYREGDPEVADWHIKWAVEHGITFFAYDWYWSRGARQLEHALHDGYFKARYRRFLKFCLLWANHNAPGTSSEADCLAVTRHWITTYFHRPEHLRIDDKPVMIIFSPDRLSADLGSAHVKRTLDLMRRECRTAGLGGLYLVACVPDAGVARQCAEEGYDAVSAYTWPHLGVPAGELFAPFETLPPAYTRQWTHIADTATIPLIPPICGGWDSRPWHGDQHFVRHDRTPALFASHLRDARDFLQARTQSAPKTVQPLVLVEAWNEFGEGSYIEPHAEFGFGYLDAIRDVFATNAPADTHTDLAPADVGRGPYDVTFPDRFRTEWTANDIVSDWAQTMDLTEIGTTGAAWSARSTGNDPALWSPPLRAAASEFASVELRMRLTPGTGQTATRDQAQLFWRTSRLPESESSSVRFPVEIDGQWHDVRIPLQRNPRWRGHVTRLRLDPANRLGLRIEIASIRLARD